MKKENRETKRIRTGRTIPIKRSHSRRVVHNDLLSKKLNYLRVKEDWDDIISILEPELAREPHDHWLLAEMASAYYEKKNYDVAYKFIVDAMSQQENCPLVLWYLASILRMRGQQDDAITIWEELVNRGEEKLVRLQLFQMRKIIA